MEDIEEGEDEDLRHILSPLINRGGRKRRWWCTPKTTASQWSERERRHWSVERRTRWVRVRGHGDEEVSRPNLVM
ncbi:hypothetical protein H5410_012840 [Solanum commersonii]|uniref:Uncharacterized protein n=1 Tax=Solanum commersonii TaxID=4109 RepID=A0A9J6AST5_SOLCO|nr:hypothetical protein H5410_012840 [Solanum commersonii]